MEQSYATKNAQALMTLSPQWVDPYLLGRRMCQSPQGRHRREQVYLAHPAR